MFDNGSVDTGNKSTIETDSTTQRRKAQMPAGRPGHPERKFAPCPASPKHAQEAAS